jgi:hypothetical protein
MSDNAAQAIDQIIDGLGDWRGDTLAYIRRLISQAEPDVTEHIKWQKPTNPRGVSVWDRGGIICTGETYKDKVKLTFANGASLEDPDRLFNASLDAKVRRAIDLHQNDTIDEEPFKELISAAAALNGPPSDTAFDLTRPYQPQQRVSDDDR